jgi:hypothetical protein
MLARANITENSDKKDGQKVELKGGEQSLPVGFRLLLSANCVKLSLSQWFDIVSEAHREDDSFPCLL